jgi:hypothetical protein
MIAAFLIVIGLGSLALSWALFMYVLYHRESADRTMLQKKYDIMADAYRMMYNALTDYHLTMDHLPCNIPEDALRQMRERFCQDFSSTVGNLKTIMDNGLGELYEGQHPKD